jgi:hypothetical protein
MDIMAHSLSIEADAKPFGKVFSTAKTNEIKWDCP